MDHQSSTFDTPNCVNCLLRTEVAGTEKYPYFVCPGCRTVYLIGGTQENPQQHP